MRDILIVEDGMQERERLEQLFYGAGFSVTAVETVKEAERFLEIEQFRLAILDIGLSDKSGTYLFELIKRSGRIPYVMILTGNPSAHLKQRFLDEGAVAYIVKATAGAQNESLLDTVQSLLGLAEGEGAMGIPLLDFLRMYVNESSRDLFLDGEASLPPCRNCRSTDYFVSFSHRTQLPPIVEGRVVCFHCGQEMDPEIQ